MPSAGTPVPTNFLQFAGRLCLDIASRWHSVTGDFDWYADWHRVNQP